MGTCLIWGIDRIAAEPQAQLCYLLIRTSSGSVSHVFDLSKYPRGAGFFCRLFALSAMTHRIAVDEVREAKSARVTEDDWAYGSIVKYMFDVDSRKLEGYTGVPVLIRRNLGEIVDTETCDGRKTVSLEVDPSNLRFIHHMALRKFVPPGSEWGKLNHTPQFEDSSLLPPNIVAMLGEQARLAEGPIHWTDLYHLAAMRRELPRNVIRLKVAAKDMESKTREDEPGLPRTVGFCTDLGEVIGRNRQVVVAGRAGMGKSTVLAMLLHEEIEKGFSLPGDKRTLPFLVRLSQTVITSHATYTADLLGDGIVQELALMPSETLCRWDRLPRTGAGEFRRQDPSARTGILNDLRSTVGQFFVDDTTLSDRCLLLLDGLNEVSGNALGRVLSCIEELTQRDVRLAITSRIWPLQRLPTGLRCFEVQEMDLPQIRSYVQSAAPDVDMHTFEEHVLRYPRCLALARVPFFLEMMCKNLSHIIRNPQRLTEAGLIESFVHLSIGRKTVDQPVPLPEILPEVRDRFLADVGCRLISLIAHGRGIRSLGFPYETDGLFTGGHPVDHLIRTCEMHGLIHLYQSLEPVGTRIEFVHDYLMCFFAAKHLQSLPQDRLLRGLFDIAEYVDWDLPLVMFLQMNYNAALGERVIAEVSRIDNKLAVLCALHAQLPPQVVLEMAGQELASKFVSIPPLSPRELWPTGPLGVALLGTLPVDDLEAFIKSDQAPDGNGPYGIMAMSFLNIPDRIRRLRKLFASYPEHHSLFCIAASCSGMFEGLQFLLELLDAPNDSEGLMVSSPFLRQLEDVADVTSVWSLATTEHRAGIVASMLPGVCSPVGNDLPLLKKMLVSGIPRLRQAAAMLLLRLDGTAAIRDVMTAYASSKVTCVDALEVETIANELKSMRVGEIEPFVLQLLALRRNCSGLRTTGHAYCKWECEMLCMLGNDRALEALARVANLSPPDRPAWNAVWLDALETWPDRAAVRRSLETYVAKNPGQDRLALWLGMLGDKAQRRTVSQRVLLDWSTVRPPEDVLKAFRRVATSEHNTRDLETRVGMWYDLPLAVRACANLRIQEGLPAISRLLALSIPGTLLHVETLSALAVLGGPSRIKEVFEHIDNVPEEGGRRSFVEERILLRFVSSLDATVRASVIVEMAGRALKHISERGRPGRGTVESIENIVRDGVDDELLRHLLWTLDDLQKGDTETEKEVYELACCIRRTRGRRFLKGTSGQTPQG